jgi:L-alanine-DL-glutamate epimerase-like enolase superfamily enzyme
MKITAVEAIPFAIPYVKPLKFASGEVHTADHVLVRVHTDDGVVGVAEAPPRPFTYGETQAGIVAVIEQLFAPALVGLTPDRARGRRCAVGAHHRQPRPPNPLSTWRSGMRWDARSNFP